MKKIYLSVLVALTSYALLNANIAFAETPTPSVRLASTPEQNQAAHLSSEVLQRFHYKAIPLNDALSAKIFDRYLKSLDSEKLYFTKADIDRINVARTRLDDAILSENLNAPFSIFNLYKSRISERITYAQSLLKQGFEFTANESYQYDREKATWFATDDEAREHWRKRVKNDWLRLKLAGKADKEIVTLLSKRYDNYLKGITKLKGTDAFESFMNAYAMSVDPHTNYFGIRAGEDFDISMKLSLEGIGAVLEDKDEYATIREMVPGGPAALSTQLKVGDRIAGVGQGKAPITDVAGYRLDDTVALIRGEANSEVTLEILPADAGLDAPHKFVKLIRKKISLDKQAAKKSIIEVKNGDKTNKIGVITLPIFYEDFAAKAKGDKDYRSTTRDFEALLIDLKKENVDSLLVDLRNNGGGSLEEAINLTGLFIDQGPVLQERDTKGDIKVDIDKRKGTTWDKPMGVLINRSSASASEIFAAAIQDYNRGLIIGETSFGKGTVQTVIDLDQLVKNEKPKFGEVKLTIAQFFRINGSTTQLKGVVPDVTLPSATDPGSYGESSFDNALAWSQIKPAEYKVVGDFTGVLPALKANHEARMAADKDFQYLIKDISDFNVERKKNELSLNLAARQKERDTKDALLKSRESKDASPVNDDGLQANERKLEADIAIENANKKNKDILLTEAANILNDALSASQSKANVTTR